MNFEHPVLILDQLQPGGVTFTIERSGPDYTVVFKAKVTFRAGNPVVKEAAKRRLSTPLHVVLW